MDVLQGPLSVKRDIQKFLDRRKPGESRYTTARKEGDPAEIVSGVFDGRPARHPHLPYGQKYGPAFQGLWQYCLLLPSRACRLHF